MSTVVCTSPCCPGNIRSHSCTIHDCTRKRIKRSCHLRHHLWKPMLPTQPNILRYELQGLEQSRACIPHIGKEAVGRHASHPLVHKRIRLGPRLALVHQTRLEATARTFGDHLINLRHQHALMPAHQTSREAFVDFCRLTSQWSGSEAESCSTPVWWRVSDILSRSSSAS